MTALLVVSHNSSVYLGIVWMLDTAMDVLERANLAQLPTLPDTWEEEMSTQLAREAFVSGADLQVVGWLRCESAKDRAAMERAGTEPMRFEPAFRRLLETDASLFGLKEPVNQSAGSIVGTQGGYTLRIGVF